MLCIFFPPSLLYSQSQLDVGPPDLSALCLCLCGVRELECVAVWPLRQSGPLK